MTVTNTTRLNKAAREFNVGTGTIVEFLHKKGFNIDSNPNTKLTPEMYELLTVEYKGERTVKDKARNLGIAPGKRETISITDRKAETIDIDDADEEEDIIIRNVTVEVDENFKKAVGFRAKEEAVSTAEKQVADRKTEIPASRDITAREMPGKPSGGEFSEISKPKEMPEETAPEKADIETTPIGQVADTFGADVKIKGPGADMKIDIPSSILEPEEGIIFTRPPDGEKILQPKIVGKIDLDAINERTKPLKKTAEEKRREKEEKKQLAESKKKTVHKTKSEEEAIAAKHPPKIKVPHPPLEEPVKEEISHPAEPQPEIKKEEIVPDNFIRTTFEKLQGPNIIGKIELPEKKKPEKKDPVASSSDDRVRQKKKKRKRIKKSDEMQGQESRTPGSQTGVSRPGQKFPQDKITGQKPSDDKSKLRQKARPHGKREEKIEPTAEEIQKQIKDTLARLSGTGKSKTSKHRRHKRDLVSKLKEQEMLDTEESKHTIQVAEFVTANELATMINIPVTQVISMCMQLGLVVSINQRLDAETITLVAEEFGYKVEFASAESTIGDGITEVDSPEDLVHRAPIVTVMGHVDHGKTKLLDHIRHTNVIAGEAGGITQHIGAYEVTLDNGKKITFLDTPGHEAFTAMRARGAKITDVAIIVIATDDSVMPQTKEAINHALAANVPIVFALNKIDKPSANPDRIREQLSQMNILVEEWGGKYQSQEISAKAGINVDVLLDKVLLEAEILDLKANPQRSAVGTIIESSLDKGRGYVAKLLVQNGTLKTGDVVLAGSYYGKVKAMYNERNQMIKSAGPATPLIMLGMSGAPQAGDVFKVMLDEREAKNIATRRMQLQREQGLRTQKHITLDEIGRRIAIGDFKELNIIVKGDVDGSVEALSDSLLRLSTEEVQVNVIHKSVGAVTETDVMLASASNAIIIGFQVRPSVGARKLAEREQIDIRLYSIIYSAIEEIKSAIEGMLSPEIEEKITCNLEVREVFKISKTGTVAGCMVLDGTVTRNTTIRIIRDGIVIYTGKLGSLKRFKDDVKEVSAGYECGLNIENYNDIKAGDIIEGFEKIAIARKLN